jgi:Protein of unknown function (DUF1826)
MECAEDNGCSFWNQDVVPFRLVATYRGPCTQYVHPYLSQQMLLYQQDDSHWAQSLTLPDVAFFKGRLFADKDSDDDSKDTPTSTCSENSLLHCHGIVYCSPHIEGSGVVRVVLVLDIPTDFHSDEDEEQGEEQSEAKEESLDDFTEGSEDAW